MFIGTALRGRSGELADGAVEVGKELDEVRQPGDVEDLAVVGDNPQATTLRRAARARASTLTISAMPVELM